MKDLRGLYGAVPLAHFFLQERLTAGALVVDATCGNGQDTLLLAELVGAAGRVWAFDIQEAALAKTGARLAAAGLESRVVMVHAGHERLAEFVTEPLQAVTFNLGYLPTGDREIKTAAATTVTALQQAAALLKPGGFILIAVYTGHAGGEEEWEAVRRWCAALPPHDVNVWQARQLNRSAAAPFLVVIEKITGAVSPQPANELLP
jgi:predicted methyltransferase